MIPYNPFSPGNGLIPPYLAGRQVECDLFEEILADPKGAPRNLVLSGLRGVGKTALLHRFHEIGQCQGWVPVRREFGPRQSQEAALVLALLSAVLDSLGPDFVHRWFAPPPIGFHSESGGECEPDLGLRLLESLPGTLEDRLSGVLEKILQALEETGFRGLVLLLDEFQAVKDDEKKGEYPLSLFLESISRLQQERAPIRLVLSGLPDLLANLVECKTYCERMFTARSVDHLDPEEASLAIQLPMREVKAVIAPEALDAVVRDTRGYPYFLQLYAFELVRSVGASIGLADYERVRPRILLHLDESFYAWRYAVASDLERRALVAIADAGHEASRMDIQRRLGLGPNYANQIILSLVEKGLILRTGRTRYRFALPLFEEFLSRQERQQMAA